MPFTASGRYCAATYQPCRSLDGSPMGRIGSSVTLPVRAHRIKRRKLSMSFVCAAHVSRASRVLAVLHRRRRVRQSLCYPRRVRASRLPTQDRGAPELGLRRRIAACILAAVAGTADGAAAASPPAESAATSSTASIAATVAAAEHRFHARCDVRG